MSLTPVRSADFARMPQGQEPAAGAFARLEWPGDVRELPAAGSPVLWFALAVGVLLVAGGLAFFARQRRVAPTPIPAAPTAQALARLRALVPPATAAPFLAFYLELKAVLRLHAQECFGVVAVPLTSEELRQRLRPNHDLGAALDACDAVLFARGVADEPAHRAAFAQAERWLLAAAGGTP